MPWHKVHNHSECPSDQPWAVVKDADGEVEGCHDSEDAADRQLAALYASEPDQELDDLVTDLTRGADMATRHSPENGRFIPGPGSGGGAGGKGGGAESGGPSGRGKRLGDALDKHDEGGIKTEINQAISDGFDADDRAAGLPMHSVKRVSKLTMGGKPQGRAQIVNDSTGRTSMNVRWTPHNKRATVEFIDDEDGAFHAGNVAGAFKSAGYNTNTSAVNTLPGSSVSPETMATRHDPGTGRFAPGKGTGGGKRKGAPQMKPEGELRAPKKVGGRGSDVRDKRASDKAESRTGRSRRKGAGPKINREAEGHRLPSRTRRSGAEVEAFDDDFDQDFDATEMAGPFKGWHGVLTLEGRETGDGREFAPESLVWTDPPLPLMWQQQSEPQHNRSVVVGRIDRLERRGAEILGWGVIDLGSNHGQEVARQMGNDTAGGVSVDVDSVKDADVEMIYAEQTEEDVKSDGDVLMLFGPPPEKVVFHKGRIRGATLVALPAFVEAKLRLLSEDETAELIAALAVHDDAPLPEPNPALAAAGGPLYPPLRWFQDPQHEGPTAWTVDQEGRVWGHLALWSSCHTTFADRCITPPREGDFPYFLRREIETEEGELVGVGQITMGTGHAALGLGSRPAAAHYDNTGLAMVDCAVGVDRWGIWIAGALRPSVEGVKLRELRAASLSGDWRRIGGKLRLVAVLAVNVPGFPVPRTRARFASEQPTSLVAAGVVTEERVSRYKLPRVETRSDGAVVLRRSRMPEEV